MNETMRKTIIDSMNDIINCLDDNIIDDFKLILFKYDNTQIASDDIMKELLTSFLDTMHKANFMSVDDIIVERK